MSEILEHVREQATLNPPQEVPIEIPPLKLNAREKAYKDVIDRKFDRPGQPIQESKNGTQIILLFIFSCEYLIS